MEETEKFYAQVNMFTYFVGTINWILADVMLSTVSKPERFFPHFSVIKCDF